MNDDYLINQQPVKDVGSGRNIKSAIDNYDDENDYDLTKLRNFKDNYDNKLY